MKLFSLCFIGFVLAQSTQATTQRRIECRSSLFANHGLTHLLVDEVDDAYLLSLSDLNTKNSFLSALGLPLKERKIYTFYLTIPKSIPNPPADPTKTCQFSGTLPVFLCGMGNIQGKIEVVEKETGVRLVLDDSQVYVSLKRVVEETGDSMTSLRYELGMKFYGKAHPFAEMPAGLNTRTVFEAGYGQGYKTDLCQLFP